MIVIVKMRKTHLRVVIGHVLAGNVVDIVQIERYL